MKGHFTDFKKLTDGAPLSGSRAGQPLIGLSVNMAGETSRLHEAYLRAVSDAGGIPIMIPAATDADSLREIVEMIDGLILSGGADIAGEYFGEETLEGLTDIVPGRDAYDFLLLKLADDRQIPVFGICRGMQVINVAFGGSLWQDIRTQYGPEYLDHNIISPREKPAHSVIISENSVLSRIFETTSVGVNSRHHQAVKQLASGFVATAVSPDGIVEAIEGYPTRRILGVQWHPENMAAEDGDKNMTALFRFFIDEADLFKKAKNLHARFLTVDSHCDTPMLFEDCDIDIGRREPAAQVDLPKMKEGRLDSVFIVAYIPQGEREERSHFVATAKAVYLLKKMKDQIVTNAENVGQAVTFADADRLKSEGRKSIFLGVENGYAVGNDLKNLSVLKEMGVVYMTLCHNGANDICDSAVGDTEHGGLSRFGREVVGEMNRLGIAVDLSHAAESTFYDVLKESTVPVICSHSSARALCDQPRNLSDDQIKALAANGGVVQICLYNDFLTSGRDATIMDAVDHIDHVVDLVGADHVGIGSDFDGGGGIRGCGASNEIINITVELLRRGYTNSDIEKILGGNLRRVFDIVQQSANCIM